MGEKRRRRVAGMRAPGRPSPPTPTPSPAPDRGTRIKANVTIVVAVVGIVAAAAVPLYIAHRPSRPEQFVAECRAEHGAPTRPPLDEYGMPTIAEEGVPVVWADCVWPLPVPGTTDDGYFRIAVTRYAIPGASMAEQFSEVNVFESECEYYRIRYQYDSQGTVEQTEPFTVRTNQVLSGYDGKAVTGGLAGLPPTAAGPNTNGNLIVLANGRHQPSEVTCAAPPRPSGS